MPVQVSPLATDLVAGTYSLSVTDANGCSIASQSNIISEPSAALSMNVAVSHVNCFGDNTGSAEAVVSGGTTPYTYSWSSNPPQITANATGLLAGTYTLQVTDSKGCLTLNNSIIIAQPPSALSANISSTNIDCKGDLTGAASASVTGGTGAYTFSWNTNPPQSTSQAINLSAGIYSVVVTDQNGCTLSPSSVSILEPAMAISVNTTKTNISCYGGNTGSATVSVEWRYCTILL